MDVLPTMVLIQLTIFVDTSSISRLHGSSDHGDEFPAYILLLCIDTFSDRISEILEDLLVDAKLLLQHVEASNVRPVLTGPNFNLSMEVFDQTHCVAGETRDDSRRTA